MKKVRYRCLSRVNVFFPRVAVRNWSIGKRVLAVSVKIVSGCINRPESNFEERLFKFKPSVVLYHAIPRNLSCVYPMFLPPLQLLVLHQQTSPLSTQAQPAFMSRGSQ